MVLEITGGKYEDLIAQVLALSDFERGEFLDQLRAVICIECGRDDPDCPCWNED